MRIALASCAELPPIEDDDAWLKAAFRRAECIVDTFDWRDASAPWADYDACLIRTTWDYTAHVEEFRQWVRTTADALPLFNEAPLILANLDKRYLAQLGERGIRIIPTRWIAAGEEVDPDRLRREAGWEQAMLKPVIGLGSEKTLPFGGEQKSAAAARSLLATRRSDEAFMLQPFLASVQSEGEYSLIYFDGRLSHAVLKIPKAGDYRVQDDFGARDAAVAPPPGAEQIAEEIFRALDGEPLYARVDLLRDDDGELCLNELELIEPSLFFRHAPQAADRLVDGLRRRVT